LYCDCMYGRVSCQWGMLFIVPHRSLNGHAWNLLFLESLSLATIRGRHSSINSFISLCSRPGSSSFGLIFRSCALGGFPPDLSWATSQFSVRKLHFTTRLGRFVPKMVGGTLLRIDWLTLCSIPLNKYVTVLVNISTLGKEDRARTRIHFPINRNPVALPGWPKVAGNCDGFRGGTGLVGQAGPLDGGRRRHRI
jgi:hypothetical protein